MDKELRILDHTSLDSIVRNLKKIYEIYFESYF